MKSLWSFTVGRVGLPSLELCGAPLGSANPFPAEAGVAMTPTLKSSKGGLDNGVHLFCLSSRLLPKIPRSREIEMFMAWKKPAIPFCSPSSRSPRVQKRIECFFLIMLVIVGYGWGARYQHLLFQAYPAQLAGRAAVSDPWFTIVFVALAFALAFSLRPFFWLAASCVLASLPNELRYFHSFSILLGSWLSLRLLFERGWFKSATHTSAGAFFLCFMIWACLGMATNWFVNGWHIGIKTSLLGVFRHAVWVVLFLFVLGSDRPRSILTELREGIIWASLIFVVTGLLAFAAFYAFPEPLNVSCYWNNFYYNRLSGISGFGPHLGACAIIVSMLALACYWPQVRFWMGNALCKKLALRRFCSARVLSMLWWSTAFLFLVMNGSRSLWLLAVLCILIWGLRKKTYVFFLLAACLVLFICLFGFPRGLPTTGHIGVWMGKECDVPSTISLQSLKDPHRLAELSVGGVRDPGQLTEIKRQRCWLDIQGQPRYGEWFYWVIGIGLGNANALGGVNNEVLLLLEEVGIPGLFFYCAAVLLMIKKVRRYETIKNDRLFILISIGCITFIGLFHIVHLFGLWNTLLLMLAAGVVGEPTNEAGLLVRFRGVRQ